MAQSYPSGPAGVATGSITSYDDPVVILVFLFWGLSACCFAAFYVYRANLIAKGVSVGPVRARRDSRASTNDDDGANVEMVSAVIDNNLGAITRLCLPRQRCYCVINQLVHRHGG